MTSHLDTNRYLVVSTDSHAGPSLQGDLREYCPARYLDEFDAYATQSSDLSAGRQDLLVARMLEHFSDSAKAAMEQTRTCPGQADHAARLQDMDADGVVADVIFPGGQNGEVLPFVGLGFGAGEAAPLELQAVGCEIWNRWLADFVSGAPERHAGVMQVPIADLPTTLELIQRGHDAGLRAVNFPAPRLDFPSYNEPIYEPLWNLCESLGLPLCVHSGGGELPLGVTGPAGGALYAAEVHWLGRRALHQLILAGVFERHPGLKLVFTEQRVSWIPEALNDLDSVYASYASGELRKELPRKPSEYWASNCFVAGSFLAPFELELRDVVGPRNLMWGTDYPHVEGTWPYTKESIRFTFSHSDEDEARAILGLNAIDVFGLDRSALEAVAERVGPTDAEVRAPIDETDLPEHRGLAFREIGAYA